MNKTVRVTLVTALLLPIFFAAHAQSSYLQYSYQFYQKFDDELYSTKTRAHTSLKPYILSDSVLIKKYQTLINVGSDTLSKHSWVHRKLFNEHLIDVHKPDYTFFADYLPDYTAGGDISNHQKTWLITNGYQLGGTIGKKFYFYSSGYENNAVFPSYLNDYVSQLVMIPGQGQDRNPNSKEKDWTYVTALVSYTPIKYLNITIGNDKTFIGDGYRSMLLSDFSAPYPFLKLTANLGNVQYMAMWTYMQDPTAVKVDPTLGNRKKWGAFHYLDWNVNNRLSLGFFEAVIWEDANDAGNKRGFDFSYANPIIFLNPIELSNGSPDNSLIGFNGKYKISNQVTAYGQVNFDEFEFKNFFSDPSSSRNKYGYQVGLKGGGIFNIPNLNYLVEYNAARPYTYSEISSILNYGQQKEPLAHPFGGNFKEIVGIANYSYKRFDFSGEIDYARYGLDYNGLNYGKDIALDYRTQANYKGPVGTNQANSAYASTGNYIGQGLTTDMYYAEGKIAYLLNPKYNLRIELGALYRKERNSMFTDRTKLFTIGLRSSFRNIYQDLASYRVHQ
jgi:hypothetical protein